jgi:hypothetical protein
MKAGLLALLALTGAADAPPPLPPPSALEIVMEGQRGLALFECAALAGHAVADPANANRLSERGREALTRFIDEATVFPDQEAMRKALNDQVPVHVLRHLAGPTTDFKIGRLWEVKALRIQDLLYERETSFHQRLNPGEPHPDYEAIQAKAAEEYARRNCGGM